MNVDTLLSSYTVPQKPIEAPRCAHIAGLYRGTRLIKHACNLIKTHPYLARFTDFPFLHAESHVILRHGLDNCAGLDMLVIRKRKDSLSQSSTGDDEAPVSSGLTMSKPCDTCRALIKLAKIRHVYYSDWNGDIKEL